MPIRTFACVLAHWLFAVTAVAQTTPPPPHPLDPLTAAEIRQAASVLKKDGRLTEAARFATIVVNPEAKTGNPARSARILGYDWSTNQGFLGIVDLRSSKVTRWAVVDSEPPMRLLVMRRLDEIAHADPRWVAAMKARKIDTGRVSQVPWLQEQERLPRRGTDRVVTAGVWPRDGQLSLDSFRIVVNLTQGHIDSIMDAGQVRPMDSAAAIILARLREPLSQLTISQPMGSSIRISGHEILWDRWRLRVGLDPRQGLEVHDVAYRDGQRWRPVLYSGSVSEIVAPYGDSAFQTWYPRDEGDYGMGLYGANSMVPLNDAPANAKFLDATMHDHLGRPVIIPRAIAVYERSGGVLWRHARDSRAARQLVVSTTSTIDNYDYVFNWIFGQDGAIESEVVLSGIMNFNPTTRQRDTANPAGHTALGHLVGAGTNAPHHQHFFSYRLDLDVDGTTNTVYELDTRGPDGPGNPKGELIETTVRPLAAERGAIQDVSFGSARRWRIVNPRETNGLGQATGYTLLPGAVTPVYARPGSAPLRTAGYMAHQLWVTPYEPEELYAAGEFQNLGLDNEGLPKWTAADRPLLDRDVVLWHTLGVSHFPRPEDWPYMPAHRAGFQLVPTAFFTRNPALDVPPARR